VGEKHEQHMTPAVSLMGSTASLATMHRQVLDVALTQEAQPHLWFTACGNSCWLALSDGGQHGSYLVCEQHMEINTIISTAAGC
jgi:hypothetical protein